MQQWSPVPKSVARRIEDMIESGALADGVRLPSQREMASSFGVCRASVREALSLLEASGVLRTEPGRGTYVCAGEAKSAAQILAPGNGTASALQELLSKVTYTKLDICRFRHLIEGESGRLAAMRITDAQVHALERNLSTFKDQTRAMQLEESARTDFEFHRLIIGFAGVQLFADVHFACRDLVMDAVRIPTSQYNRAWEPVAEHERILEALRRRDPDEARYYMQSHIVRSAERLGILLASDVV
jgi:GntR family transcriptional repressor for pyruvate dehydrogenase complex